MNTHHESNPGAESLINQVLSEQRARMMIHSDFADEIARSAASAPMKAGSRFGLPLVVIVVASVLTASTAIAGIVHLIRQAQYRPAEPQGVSCAECEPLPAITSSQSGASQPVQPQRGDTAVRLAPVSAPEALTMLDELKVAPLLRGTRGEPAVDRHALAGITGRFSQLLMDLPELAEIEINPLMVGPDGAVAVDARARLDR